MTNIERTAYINLLNKAVDGNDLDFISDQIAVTEGIDLDNRELAQLDQSQAFVPNHMM